MACASAREWPPIQGSTNRGSTEPTGDRALTLAQFGRPGGSRKPDGRTRYPVPVAPPSRSARAAVLASSVQRSKTAPRPSQARRALIRRAVVVVLVLAALTLLTVSFRSPTAGALHDVQGAGSTALRPFQIAATRVAQPFRDAYDYLHSLS